MIDLLIKEDEKDLKNMGFIINEKTNTYTANIITVNGILTASQHQCISKAAELFGNGIIKLSTSFTIEVRGIPYEKINDFRKYIEDYYKSQGFLIQFHSKDERFCFCEQKQNAT